MRQRRILPPAGDGSKLTEMIGAVIYVRVSTKEQTENLSLPTQLRACEEYCRRQGYEILERFHEEGESAKTTDRSQLQALLKYCRTHKGKVHFVVVYNITRFAREKYDHFALRALLKSLGISLRSATEPIDDTSTGKLMEGVLAAFAQFDNDVRSDRTRAGMRAALERGVGHSRPRSATSTRRSGPAQASSTTPNAVRSCGRRSRIWRPVSTRSRKSSGARPKQGCAVGRAWRCRRRASAR
jgi:DNA invertase Pin-like site-specific DNA recombinase